MPWEWGRSTAGLEKTVQFDALIFVFFGRAHGTKKGSRLAVTSAFECALSLRRAAANLPHALSGYAVPSFIAPARSAFAAASTLARTNLDCPFELAPTWIGGIAAIT